MNYPDSGVVSRFEVRVMRARLVVVAVLLVVSGWACGTDDIGPVVGGVADDRIGSVQLLRHAGTAVGVDLVREELTLAVENASASADGSVVAAATAAAGETELRFLAADTGTALGTWVLDGDLWPRTVSPDGQRAVLLGHAPPVAADGYEPPGRRETRVVVASRDGSHRELRIAANVEPEAFSRDGRSLFVVEFEPPENPDRYRVRRMDLGTGHLDDVYSVDKALQEEMRGTARTQAWSRDGRRMYTLYTLGVAGHANAFVHVLDLDEQWAHCVDLPPGLGTGDSGTTALAVSRDGERLDVLDSASGQMATIDTQDLTLLSMRSTEGLRSGQVAASSTADGVVAAVDAGLVVFRGADRLATSIPMHDVGAAIGASGEQFVLIRGNEALIVNSHGEVGRRLALPWGNAKNAEAPAGVLTDGRQAVECAC